MTSNPAVSLDAIETGTVDTSEKVPAVKAVRKSFSSPIASLLVIVLTVLWTVPTFGLLVTSVRPSGSVATTGWWPFFLLRTFGARLPRGVMEAAQVDGATDCKIFRSIVLPLATPALASFAIFQFLWVWNDLLVALTFAGGTPDVARLTARLAQLTG